MENKDFKILFGDVGKSRGFLSLLGYWYVESQECILALELQKSNFGNYYYLNVKTFIQGVFGKEIHKDKKLKTEMGHIFRRPPAEYDKFLDLDIPMDKSQRKQGLELLFDDFILPYAKKVLTRQGIQELAREERIIIPPGVKKELELLMDSKKV